MSQKPRHKQVPKPTEEEIQETERVLAEELLRLEKEQEDYLNAANRTTDGCNHCIVVNV